MTTKASPATEAVGRLVGAYSALTRELSSRLEAEFGVTLSDYEVLHLLSHAEDRRMRRVDLAREVRLSPSGITRMLDRLERSGLVEKGSCETDARITYAVLTDAGVAKLEECWPAHNAAAERLLGERLDQKELASLTGLLARLYEGDGECEPGSG